MDKCYKQRNSSHQPLDDSSGSDPLKRESPMASLLELERSKGLWKLEPTSSQNPGDPNLTLHKDTASMYLQSYGQAWSEEGSRSSSSADSFVKNEESCDLMEWIVSERQISAFKYLEKSSRQGSILSRSCLKTLGKRTKHQLAACLCFRSAKSDVATRATEAVVDSDEFENVSFPSFKSKLPIPIHRGFEKSSSDMSRQSSHCPSSFLHPVSSHLSSKIVEEPRELENEHCSDAAAGDQQYSPSKSSLCDHTPLETPLSLPCTTSCHESGLKLVLAFNPFRSSKHQLLLTVVPVCEYGQVGKPHFDWVSESFGTGFLVKATCTVQTNETPVFTICKFLADEHCQNKQLTYGGSNRFSGNVLTLQHEVHKRADARLIGMLCTSAYILVLLKTKDNVMIWVYDASMQFLNTEWLMKNPDLLRESAAGDVQKEKVSAFNVDKAENTLIYYHYSRESSQKSDVIHHRICIVSLPDLHLSKKISVVKRVSSIKVGTKFFAVHFADQSIAIFCKHNKSPTCIFEMSSQKKLTLFSGSDCFEMDNRDMFIQVTNRLIRVFFHNGVLYKEFDCKNLDILGGCHIVGRRKDFVEALLTDVSALKFESRDKKQAIKLTLNNKLIRATEEYLVQCKEKVIPLVLCDNMYKIDHLVKHPQGSYSHHSTPLRRS